MAILVVLDAERGNDDFRNHLLHSWLEELNLGGREGLHATIALGIVRHYQQRIARSGGDSKTFLRDRLKRFLFNCVESDILSQTDALSLMPHNCEPSHN